MSNKARKAIKQNDLISHLHSLWLKDKSDQNAIALSIFEVENIDVFDTPEHIMMLLVLAARKLLRRETDYICLQGHNRLVITSISSFLKHAHHQVRIHELLKQVTLFSKRGRNESVRVSGGFAVFSHQEQHNHGIFDLYNLALQHLHEGLKVGNTVKTQKGTHIPTPDEVPPLADVVLEHNTKAIDRRTFSLTPSSWIEKKIAN